MHPAFGRRGQPGADPGDSGGEWCEARLLRLGSGIGEGGGNVSDRISVVIAEDSLLVRDSVSRALSTDPDVTVVGVAEDYDSAVELVDEFRPTILVTDIRMPPTSTDEGIRLARWMRSAHPDAGVIVLSNYADPGYATGLLEGGSAGRGYLLKERVARFDELNDAVRQVAGAGRCSIRWSSKRCLPSPGPCRDCLG